MVLHHVPYSPRLESILRSRHEDRERPLLVRWTGEDVEILRADGSELAPSERAHCEAAAYALAHSIH